MLRVEKPHCEEAALHRLYLVAVTQIEWAIVVTESANTPLSVIPAEAGIQCLWLPGHWIPAKNVQE